MAKDSFVACFGSLQSDQHTHFGKTATFTNNAAGFAHLLSWVAKQVSVQAPLWFVLEATGVYYEALAYFLADQEYLLSVLLPNKAKHFAQSTTQKSKTDQLDARLLCRLGLERSVPPWQPPTTALRRLRALARERQVLTQHGVKIKARVHAYQHSYRPEANTLARLLDQQKLLVEQISLVDQELKSLLTTNPELGHKVELLTSIPGIGMTTAIIVIAETSGFTLTHNERQLASYAGLDVVQRQSGLTTFPASISRRGNVRLRTALYLPAMSSLRYNSQQRAFFARLKARHPNGKPGVIAVMRKLLLLCYALWKTDKPYQACYGSTLGN